MPDNPITVPLPQDLPTDWTYGQTIGADGTDVGLTQQHGYNYLMQQVNASQQAAQEIGAALEELTADDVGAFPATEDPNNPGCYYRMNSGTQEWINPPLIEGIDYRTVQRWNGNPVYIRNVGFSGALPNNSTAAAAFGPAIPFDTTQVVSLETVIVNSTTNVVKTLPAFNDDGSPFATQYFEKYTDGSLTVVVRTFDDASTWTASSMVLKYAKIES